MIFFELVLTFIALFLISLSIKKHKKQILKNIENKFILNFLVTSGWVLLIASVFLFVNNYSLGIGLTYWFGIISFNSFFIAVLYGRLKR